MKKLYIVFDQIPHPKSGGLITSYINLVKLLNDKYEIHILSIFDCEKENKELFKDYPIHVVSNHNIDIRFYRLITYLKEKNIIKFFKALVSIFIYFLSIPILRMKTKKLINENDALIVSSPSAGTFISKDIKYILEIHTKYEYFFGNNLIGKMQSKLMTKPSLTLFRTKTDALKASFNADYMYNSIDFDKNALPKENVDNKLVFVGRLSKEKNLFKMLQVIKLVTNTNPDIILDIYGTGIVEDQIRQEIKELGLENNVFLKGYCTDKYIYHNYSIFLLTSDIEGFPLTIIEAKANGTPTISTKWGEAVNETIEDGKDGFIIDSIEEMADKIKLLLNDKQLLESMSRRCLENVDTFSKENAKQKWIEILK